MHVEDTFAFLIDWIDKEYQLCGSEGSNPLFLKKSKKKFFMFFDFSANQYPYGLRE